MDLLRISGATLNQIPLDWDGNSKRIIELIEQAKIQKVGVLCFPELAITGYNCEDMFFSLHVARQSVATLIDIASFTSDIICFIGLPIFANGSMYNCVACVQNGKILGVVPKKVLPREGVHYEPRWFEAWRFGEVSEIIIESEIIPFGDLRFEFGKLSIGVEICEEAWQSEGSSSAHAFAGTELIVNPSASHFALGKYSTRETLVKNSSRSLQVHYLYTNLVGLENGRIIYDGGVIIGEYGQITKRGRRFGFSEGELLIHDVDLDEVRVSKIRSRPLKQASVILSKDVIVKGSPTVYKGARQPIAPQCLGTENIPYQPEEEFLWAEMLGLFDYLRKTRSKGFAISLSGGCDSATVAVLVAHMVSEALRELGPDRLALVLGVKKPEEQCDNPRSWIKILLTLVYQATNNNSDVTAKAASGLAEALNAEFHHVDVQDCVDQYVRRASEMIGREMTWQQDDLALQNIQARSRAPMIWILANIKNAVLLSTSNRSEAAVGYATMDGDTAGGLSPIAGIHKSFLLNWLNWAEKFCPVGLGPISELVAINSQQPTAELRPQDIGQTDEGDLMPYVILNTIEKWLIRDRMSPQSILDKLVVGYAEYSRQELKAYVEKFLQLWSRNQWKRERYAPGFHLDDESLDPKSWCRFPILSSGFSKEIKELI